MNTFRLPDEAALNAMLKRSHVRVVKPMDVKSNTPSESEKAGKGEQANEAGRPPHLDDKPAPKPDNKAFLKKTSKKRAQIDYVGALVRQMTEAGIDGFTLEHYFARDINRKWRIDVAFVDLKLAVEVDGMGHRIKDRFLRDIEKNNELVFHGWRLLRIYTRWISTERAEVFTGIDLVKRALDMREGLPSQP